MNSKDLYHILGVLADAHEVVIRAAYKALAQRYHPDKWPQDPEWAHRHMADINKAYHVLGDPIRRKEYDKTQTPRGSEGYASSSEGDFDGAFQNALEDIEERWKTATSFFPDLNGLRTRLGRVSYFLAFSFVTLILELKDFDKRKQLAEELERKYLEKYFGTHPEIIAYASDLIRGGHKDAAKALNRFIDVLGTKTDPHQIIKRIELDFGQPRDRPIMLRSLAKFVRESGAFHNSKALAEYMGYQVDTVRRGFFAQPTIQVRKDGAVLSFSISEFTSWVKNTLCPQC